MAVRVDTGRTGHLVCPSHVMWPRADTNHLFDVAYADGVVEVTHRADDMCVGVCDWAFVLKFECCATAAAVPSPPVPSPPVAMLPSPTTAPPPPSPLGPLGTSETPLVTGEEEGGGDETPVGLIVALSVLGLVCLVAAGLCVCMPVGGGAGQRSSQNSETSPLRGLERTGPFVQSVSTRALPYVRPGGGPHLSSGRARQFGRPAWSSSV